MVHVWQRAVDEKLQARLLLQVHDELIVEAPEEEIDEVNAFLKEEMGKRRALQRSPDDRGRRGKDVAGGTLNISRERATCLLGEEVPHRGGGSELCHSRNFRITAKFSPPPPVGGAPPRGGPQDFTLPFKKG